MAELAENDQGKKKKGEKPKPKKQSTRIDMTPMVDLGFLLLTFFILTTTFGKPQIMELNMPVPNKDQQQPTKFEGDRTMTILVDKGKMFFYMGVFTAEAPPALTKVGVDDGTLRKEVLERNRGVYQKVRALQREFQKANYSGKVIDEKREELRVNINEIKKDKNNNGLLVIIKPTSNAEYKDIVVLLDEMNICNVVNYAIVDITADEEEYLKTK